MKSRHLLLGLAAVALGLGAAFVFPRTAAVVATPVAPEEPPPAREGRARPGMGAFMAPRRASVDGARRLPLPPGSTVQNNPSAADYDPTALANLAIPPLKIFEAEPRDPAWAPVLEGRISTQLVADLGHMVPSALVKDVTCHTSSCRIVLGAPKKHLDDMLAAAQFVPFGDMTSIEDLQSADGVGTQAIVVMFAEHRDPAKQESEYRMRRSATIAAFAGEGRGRGGLPLPPR